MPSTRAPLAGIALCVAALAAVVVTEVRPLPWSSPRAETLPACPAVELRGDDEVPPAAAACLFGADGREGAALRVTSTTDEGDPVHVHYERHPGQPGLVVLVDQRADRYGSGGWTVQVCPDATSLTDLGACTSGG